MKLRPATHDDIPMLIELGRRLHAETRFSKFRFDPDRVKENLDAVLRDMRGVYCFLVAEDSVGYVVGGLLGNIERHLFSDQPIATLIEYGVLPEKRMSGGGYRLLLAFRIWAEKRGACELNLGVNSGIALDRTDRFFRRLGFQVTGGNYSLPLKPTRNGGS